VHSQQINIIIYKQASATSTVWLSKKHAPQKVQQGEFDPFKDNKRVRPMPQIMGGRPWGRKKRPEDNNAKIQELSRKYAV